MEESILFKSRSGHAIRDSGDCICNHSLFAAFAIRACHITVTDQRVYGKAAFGKQVDLLIESQRVQGFSAEGRENRAISRGA